MKKTFFTLILLLSISGFASAVQMPVNIDEYLNRPYVGMPYYQALNQKTPFLLIFANPDDLISMIKLSNIGKMVYDEYSDDFNFCIINTNIKENDTLLEYFNPKRLPALYIINTEKMTYRYVEKKYYKKHEMRKLLNLYIKNGTHN